MQHIMKSIMHSNVYYSHTQCWRRQWHPTPVLLPGKSHGQRSLVGCSPWGRQELYTTEQLRFHFSLSCIGEGNGNPLQCSCLDNPRDGGACCRLQGRTESDTTEATQQQQCLMKNHKTHQKTYLQERKDWIIKKKKKQKKSIIMKNL